MLRQIEWRLQNGRVTKSGVLLVMTLQRMTLKFIKYNNEVNICLRKAKLKYYQNLLDEKFRSPDRF